MKYIKHILLIIGVLGLMIACSDDFDEAGAPVTDARAFGDPGSPGSSSGNGGNSNPDQSGVITAGEWSDLQEWDFWKSLINKQDFSTDLDTWDISLLKRYTLKVTDKVGKPLFDQKVEIKENGITMWTSKTNNNGIAELWRTEVGESVLVVNDELSIPNPKLFEDEINELQITLTGVQLEKAEISFVVDATGSMGDELDFLKVELEDIINRVKQSHSNISTSSVFYRDEGDAYVTRVSEFTTDIKSTVNFIKAQSADGGGDFPEAVHSALDKSINELQWTQGIKSKIIFLLLDAPPHNTSEVSQEYFELVSRASAKGIKIIPIVASGIDKPTEFLMRHTAILTNGTYVFITDDSGIGNDHLEPSIGEYEVEFLNDLLVRLVNESME